MTPFGAGCKGTGATVGIAMAIPNGFETRFGRSDSLYPFGGQHRMQQIYAQSSAPKTFAWQVSSRSRKCATFTYAPPS